MRYRNMLLAAAVGTACLGVATNAQAAAYAYGNINFTNLFLSNLNATGVTVTSANVATSSSANYPGSAADGATAGPTNPGAPLTAGSDVRQSFSGPGPAPGENIYTQQLLAFSGTRGDAQLTGNLITGSPAAGANDVAEGHLTIPGAAASTAGTSTGFNIQVNVGQSTTFTLSFNADDALRATTTAAGEFASTNVSASFTVIGTGSTVFTPFTFAPNALNTNTSSTGGGINGSVTNASAAYTTSVTLAAGNYQFTLLSGAQERLTTPAAVPEPVSLALLGTGLLGLGIARRLRRTR